MVRVRYWLAVAVVGAAGAFTISTATTRSSSKEEIAATFRLVVELSARELSVVENDEVTSSYAVAIGEPSYPTPTGRYRIERIIWNPRWVPPDAEWAEQKTEKEPGDPDNPMGKVKIFFSEPDYYIHGTRQVDSLGEAESHGCLRMRNSEVTRLARRIMAAGGKPVSQGWVRRLLNKVRATREVRLSEPVEIIIKR